MFKDLFVELIIHILERIIKTDTLLSFINIVYKSHVCKKGAHFICFTIVTLVVSLSGLEIVPGGEVREPPGPDLANAGPAL